ncbi:DUF1570 domain-containing protein [Novipirellula artificiosorum]|uniref:DUF1570 domain-containing protein n=1 Tax=Novipirellula artificiosorum TaxID=2528016 RepID=A0A5C6E2G6_9BACT|nr:DUF1570 domain-containing protein [Novipirellula artificiosorum]TWU41801.1 hypothetical protein Poly41_00930 [Novipirellula artificiosorum]
MFRTALLLYPMLIAMALCCRLENAHGVETVNLKKTSDSKESEVTGEVLVEAQDGAIMILADDGQIWTIQPEEIVQRQSDEEELVPIDADAMASRMLAEMPAGFSVYRTVNYVIVYNTNDLHARQVAGLFEQLYRGFFAYWKNQGWELPKPRFPLVALVLADRSSFLKHAGKEVGEAAQSVIGYYHLANNRMMIFNNPDWERNVSTIIHEATHQLSYNCGLQRRYADNPMWVSEGLAMFFESPDRRNPRGWRGIGRVNEKNLLRWNHYVRNRPEESLTTLIADDTRFRNASTAEAAYAEGWALTYFLLRTKREQYVEYLRTLSAGKTKVERTKRERIEMFEKAFAMTLNELDAEFTTYMRRVR